MICRAAFDGRPERLTQAFFLNEIGRECSIWRIPQRIYEQRSIEIVRRSLFRNARRSVFCNCKRAQTMLRNRIHSETCSTRPTLLANIPEGLGNSDILSAIRNCPMKQGLDWTNHRDRAAYINLPCKCSFHAAERCISCRCLQQPAVCRLRRVPDRANAEMIAWRGPTVTQSTAGPAVVPS